MFKRKDRKTNNCSPAYTSASKTFKAFVGINNSSSNIRLRDDSLFYIR